MGVAQGKQRSKVDKMVNMRVVEVKQSSKVENWREHAPSSYSLKIKNFSQFKKSTPSSDNKYISNCFASGGYNWRLIVYPEGNEKDEGNGFISMYVEIDNASLMATPPNEVSAYLIFSIYNRKQNSYFVIHDIEAKRFNTLRTVWGSAQAISLVTFNDPKSGYIFEEDECEFGVDVIVAKPPTNCETLSFDDDKLSNPIFSWTVKNFSELKQESYKSESFLRGGKSWVLMLYPKGDSSFVDGNWLSIYLELANSESQKLKEDEKIYAEAQLRLLHPSGSNHLTQQLNRWHQKRNTCWGYPKFVSVDKVKKMYLDKEDNLKFEIEFEVVSATNYSISH